MSGGRVVRRGSLGGSPGRREALLRRVGGWDLPIVHKLGKLLQETVDEEGLHGLHAQQEFNEVVVLPRTRPTRTRARESADKKSSSTWEGT
jgi:hypothetical protein